MQREEEARKKEIINGLNDLIHLDHDVVGGYEKAIQAVKEPAIKEPLRGFKGDHERHIRDLSEAVKRLGETPVHGPGIRGVLRKGMTALAGREGTEGALKAMLSNETVTNTTYTDALSGARKENWPADLVDLLGRNLGDEKRHFAWVQDTLAKRTWEDRS